MLRASPAAVIVLIVCSMLGLSMMARAAPTRALLQRGWASAGRGMGRVRAPGCTRLACTATPATPAPAGEVTELSRLEIRVGKILEVSRHPEADGLYVEKVDVGEAEGPRTIVSGLVAYCTPEQLLNRNVVVLCNLKPRALKGINSFGMLLCASSKEGETKSAVEPLLVPEGAKIGELITFVGHKPEPEPAGNRASKAFTKVADDLFVDDSGVATYKGTAFTTAAGSITSTIKKGSIS